MNPAPQRLGEGLRWLAAGFLSRRRKWQALAVFGIMLVGGAAELFTLAAVMPLLALLGGFTTGGANGRLFTVLNAAGINPNPSSLTAVAAIFCVAALVAAGVRILLAWASQKLVFRMGYDLGMALYSRVLHQSYSFHVQLNSSRIISDIVGIHRLLTGMILPLMQAISALVLSIFTLGGLLLINFRVALIALTMFGGIYAGVSVWSRPRLRRNAAFIKTSGRERVKTVQEGLGGIRDVLLDSSQHLYVRKFARVESQLRDAQAANALIAVTPRFVVEALGMVSIVLLAMFLRAEGSIAASLPFLAALALGAQKLLPLLQTTYNGWTSVTGSEALLLSIVDLIRQPLPPRFHSKQAPVQFGREIRVQQLHFRFGATAPDVLKDINIVIPKGAFVGFVGESGVSKSTLVDLLMGLLRPTRGAILIDGVPLTEDNVLSWQAQIAHVPQHIFLADGSIIENVAFGLPIKKVDLPRVAEACRQAELHDFIESLPAGYDTLVGERGVRLSGGQRQRIGLARALYKQASVLILDEATSALDDATEASVMDAVHRLGKAYTVLMIAHRLTTIQRCDSVVRLEKGKIAAQGSFEEVLGITRLPRASRRSEHEKGG